MHYCDCKGTTKLQLLQRVFQRMFTNFQHWKDVFTTALRVFMNGIDGATSVAQTSGGGGTSSDMPWRDKDEDYLHWAYRAMRYAHAKHYPGNKLKHSLSK